MNRKTVALFLLIFLAGLDQARASKGEKAFAHGDFITASEFYTQALKKKPDDPRLHYNAGTAAYKNNLFDDAITSFQQALKSEDLGLQEQDYYNLGNALFKKGEEVLQKDPQQAEKLWQQALDAYGSSLKLNPEDRDSSENRELVTRRLEELKKQQEQQKKQQQDKNDQQQQDQKQGQQKEQQQTGDQQGEEGKQGQPKKGDQGQQQKKDSTAGQNESSPPEKNPDDQAGNSKKAQADKLGENDQKSQPAEPTEAAKEAPQQKNGAASPQAAEQGQEDQPFAPGSAPVAAEQRQSGKMTREEARQLLKHFKDEEGKLNFVPQTENGKAAKEGSWKDW
jgi:Ca-activated chloride channel family protein